MLLTEEQKHNTGEIRFQLLRFRSFYYFFSAKHIPKAIHFDSSRRAERNITDTNLSAFHSARLPFHQVSPCSLYFASLCGGKTRCFSHALPIRFMLQSVAIMEREREQDGKREIKKRKKKAVHRLYNAHQV